MPERTYTYDAISGRYRDATSGRFISNASVRSTVDAVADAAGDRMAGLAKALREGRSTLAAFETGMLSAIKDANLSAAIAARGGAAQMSPADNGAAGRLIRDQYGYARQFVADIASGKQPLDGRLEARARLYGDASVSSYEAIRGRDARARGENQERNILNTSVKEHCQDSPTCAEQRDKGWVPAGSLVPIGQRGCRSRCRCRIERSRAGGRAA